MGGLTCVRIEEAASGAIQSRTPGSRPGSALVGWGWGIRVIRGMHPLYRSSSYARRALSTVVLAALTMVTVPIAPSSDDAELSACKQHEHRETSSSEPHSHPLHRPVQARSLVAGNEAPCPHCPLMNCAADAACAGMSVDVGLAKSDTWETPVPGWRSLSGRTRPNQLGLHRIQKPPPKNLLA
jgi:hypothetical protein